MDLGLFYGLPPPALPIYTRTAFHMGGEKLTEHSKDSQQLQGSHRWDLKLLNHPGRQTKVQEPFPGETWEQIVRWRVFFWQVLGGPQEGRGEMLHNNVGQWYQVQVPLTLSKGQKNPIMWNRCTRRDPDMILYLQVDPVVHKGYFFFFGSISN